jgi:hypothetical protein
MLFGTVLLAASDRAPAPPIIVGKEVLISGADSAAYSEYMADIDPEHPDRLMACTQPWVGALNERKNTLHVSFDGGKTWKLGLEDLPVRAGLIAGDPACAYLFNNIAILSTLFQHEEEGFGKNSGTWDAWPTGIGQRIYRSTDGGATWAPPYEIGFIDNQNILVDRTGGKYHGRIYINGNVSGDPFWLIYSTDTGRTFQRGEVRHVEGQFQQFDRGTVLTNGTVVLPFTGFDKRNPDYPSDWPRTTTYVVAWSTDGGVHMSKPDTVAKSRNNCDDISLPQMATDYSNGPFRGRVYYLWSELEGASFRRDGVASRCVQVISYSDDSARTWSTPVRVTDLPFRSSSQKGPDTRLPALVVNKDGIVAVTWYDRRDDPKNRSTKLRFSASLDGGDTWLPSVPVSTKPFAVDGPRGLSVYAFAMGGGRKPRDGYSPPPSDVVETPLNAGARQTLGSMGGDYSALLANPSGTFHAFWVDNRGDATKPTQLFTTTVAVAGAVQKNGSAELAALDNVTRKVEVQYRSTNSYWDKDYLNVTLGVVLLNVSKDTIVGPLKYRILGVNSPIGPVIVRDTREEAAGAVFDLTTSLPSGGLVPNATTKLYEIKLRVGPVPRDIADAGYQSMGSFNAKILGKVRPGAPPPKEKD